MTLWLSEEAENQWLYNGPRKRGAPIIYNDRAIELMLIIKAHYNLPNRQTEGFVRSIFERAGIQLSVPDHTTL